MTCALQARFASREATPTQECAARARGLALLQTSHRRHQRSFFPTHTHTSKPKVSLITDNTTTSLANFRSKSSPHSVVAGVCVFVHCGVHLAFRNRWRSSEVEGHTWQRKAVSVSLQTLTPLSEDSKTGSKLKRKPVVVCRKPIVAALCRDAEASTQKTRCAS